MQSAATVLDVIRKRGERELPLARLYRQLFNRDLFLMAYGRIYSNKGAMTSGVTKETVDGMSMEKIDAIIRALRSERYRWAPVKRVYIPKKNGKKRPLGLPTWSDKLVAEVVRLLLETYYEPQFSDHSHGFRPHRGCHTALNEIVDVWKGTHWFIEGDVSDCFGSLDHSVMLSILADKIRDSRFLRLISHMLKAGYLEDWKWNATLSGAPQGGVASPILSNIYLDRLDRFLSSSNCCPSSTGVAVEGPIQRIGVSRTRLPRRGDTGTAKRRVCCGVGFAPCRAKTRTIPAIDACAMCATLTTGSWGSLAPGVRPRRSSQGSDGTCARNSSLNFPMTRR